MATVIYKILVPKGSEVTSSKKENPQGSGKFFTSTKFTCVIKGGPRDGQVDTKAQTSGDKVDILRKAQEAGEELGIIEAFTNNGGYTTYKFDFPNAPRQWQSAVGAKRGFEGKKVTTRHFVEVTNKMFNSFFDNIRNALPKPTTPEGDVAALAEARSLIATYWMSYGNNLIEDEKIETSPNADQKEGK